MAVQPISWKQQYVVAVTRGRKTRYFYGTKLKEAVDAANLKKGDGFAYARFERGAVQWAEVSRGVAGDVDGYIHYGPMKRGAA